MRASRNVIVRAVTCGVTVGATMGAGLALASVPIAAQATTPPATTPPAAERSAAPVEVLRPLALPRGRNAAVPYLQKNVIHLPGGRTISVRVPHTGAHLQLLGRATGGGFLVAAGRVPKNRISHATVYRVSRGRKPVRVPRAGVDFNDGSSTKYRLSRDGGQLAVTTFDRGGSSTVVRVTRTGRVLDSMYSGAFYGPADLADGRVVTWNPESDEGVGDLATVVWTPATKALRPLRGDLWGAFVRRNVLFTGTEAGGGPTSLSAPGRPAWVARFTPLDLSPDGRTVLGHRPCLKNRKSVLEVRRMDTGAVLRTLNYGPGMRPDLFADREQTARFETNNRYVFQASTAKGQVLVRCWLDGRRCRRASSVGGPFSVGQESFLW